MRQEVTLENVVQFQSWPEVFVSLLPRFVFKLVFFPLNVCSNTFTNEKMKIEECIKKGKEHYEESHQRAMAAEVRSWHVVTGGWKGVVRLLLCLFNYMWGIHISKYGGEGYPITHNSISLKYPLFFLGSSFLVFIHALFHRCIHNVHQIL